ncbi:MAG: glycosyltransferase family 9 protein [Lentisphaerae bacterium]|nr:glycosyltransferase family 9 protein [Lentisphaerota bacterium]
MLNKAMRGLILRGGALGDGLLTLPVLHALRRAFPGIVLQWAGNPRLAGLLLTAGLVQRYRSLDEAVMAELYVPRGSLNAAPPAALCWRTHAALRAGEAAWVQSFDFILHFLHDPDGVVAENLNRMGARQLIQQSPLVAEGHAFRHFLRALTELGITAPNVPEVWLPWPEANRKAGRARLNRLGLKGDVLAIHPGSGSPRKNWPLEKFMALGRRLRDEGMKVLFLLGEAEASFPALQESGMAVLREAPIETVADALSACGRYVGNDSGVTHLAAALGLPVVAIFGPTEPAVWGPLAPKSVAIRSAERTSRSLAAVPVKSVMQALRVNSKWQR